MITRQYKWQLKQLKKHRCIICGKVLSTKRHCRKHANKQNKYVKKNKQLA